MRLQSPWTPRLADIEANASERLVCALADDIVEGRLKSGDRLPAHRQLAWQLGVGLGTVTKAYAALERRGLVRSVKGRATFVAILQAHGQRLIDFSSNVPPAMLTSRLLARTLTGIARKIDADHLNLYSPPAGHLEHRRLLARWLETLGIVVEPSHLVLTGNARQAISLAFDLACGPHGVILTERLTYPGAIALARRKGYRMQGVEIDVQGMLPEALAQALGHLAATRNKVVYLTPTLHNPTTATMGAARRQAIVEVCRQAGAWIIEDGVYALGSAPEPALATLAPERVLHVNGLSKSLGPGLRIGMLTLPAELHGAAQEHLQDIPLGPSPLSCAVVEDWLSSGVVASIQQDLRHEARRRTGLAAELLGEAECVSHPDAYHIWLPMPRDAAERFTKAAAQAGIRVTAPESLMVDRDEPVTGIRLCLGGPSFEELTQGLTRLSNLLKHGPDTPA
ncbi:PLP-dependent aminotransferase family protein [Pseudomonas corrugata]|uniref:aminotransferase-like domain-containing protein n=1 Tax=Pseudomonas corrugata TaxID=47879 RepID=UPI0015867235|nr:PLP-dependent aminotransferase family protein [Pseudomonas corrugata]MCI0997786.1 PLP-dependent aminotransferase family protein [Pseudomonas corrugata]NUT66587.1 PLP-dependent aminotransferase family protein [Pseudomonas corrugata]